MTIHAEIVMCFYRLTAVKGHPASALVPAMRDLLTEDFSTTSPLLQVDGREQYLGLLGQTMQTQLSRRIHHQFVDGNQICTLYDVTIKPSEGDNLTIPMADWLTVYQGRIRRQVLYYDPRRFAAPFALEYSPPITATSFDSLESKGAR
jgi:hypothetical protein